MCRKMFYFLVLLLLVTATTTEAREKFEINAFSGFRFGGAFIDGYYQDNPILEQLDLAPGAQFGASFYIPIVPSTTSGGGMMFEIMFNFQRTDLRFELASNTSLPDSIISSFAVDGDKLILGEIDFKYIHGGIIYKFGDNSGWNPHVNFGLGATILSATNGEIDKSKFSFSIGGGVTRMFNETIGTRLQLRGYFTSLPAEEYWHDDYEGLWEAMDRNYFFQGEISGGIVFAF